MKAARMQVDDSDAGTWPFTPLMAAAIVFGGLTRMLEIHVLACSTLAGFIEFWLGSCPGPLGVGDMIFTIAVLFVAVSTLAAVARPKALSSWMTLSFCLLLLVYCAGLRFLPEDLPFHEIWHADG